MVSRFQPQGIVALASSTEGLCLCSPYGKSSGMDDMTVRRDKLSPAERSRLMKRIRGKNTKPEMYVRKMVWGMGKRYRLHGKDLPGKPDLVFRKAKKAIFVHGCFWHLHSGCSRYRLPLSRVDFWLPKLTENKRRDGRNIRALRRLGWRVLVVWECQLRHSDQLQRKLERFFTSTPSAR